MRKSENTRTISPEAVVGVKQTSELTNKLEILSSDNSLFFSENIGIIEIF